MSSDIAIRARGLGKRYALFDRPVDRLKQMLFGRFHRYYQEFWALQNIDMEIRKGEVVGIIGRNGAGKSTLLQLVCSTLQPTTGELTVEATMGLSPCLQTEGRTRGRLYPKFRSSHCGDSCRRPNGISKRTLHGRFEPEIGYRCMTIVWK